MRLNNLSILSGLILPKVVLGGSALLKADIRADSNRDGIVDLKGNTDVESKLAWNASSGAIFLPNIGDTDRRCSKIALSGPALSNSELDDCNDASDNVQRAPQFLASLKTVPIPGVSTKASGTISVKDSVARSNVRIFRKDSGDGDWVFTDGNYTFTHDQLKKGLNLGIDARDTRRPGSWDGKVTVSFNVRDGDKTSSDQVLLRVAPVQIHHHLQDVEQVIGVQGNETGEPWLVRFNDDLSKVVRGAGIGKEVYFFNASDDIWAQDFLEPGFASMPGPDGPISIRIMIRSPQDSRVAGRQLFEYYREAGVGAVQHLGGARDEINSGGNIETIPPYTFNGKEWPAGRIIVGKHGKQNHHLLPYLQAQELQDPVILETEWLVIGHVDEFVQFLPADNERGWVAMIDDPRAGVQLLKDMKSAGYGSTRALSRKNDTVDLGGDNCTGWSCQEFPVGQTKVDDLLADKEFLSLNEQCAERIDANINILKTEVGLTDDSILRLPSLFKNSTFQMDRPADRLQVGAFWPGVVNNLVLTGHNTCVAPNPWGPAINGTDILAEKVKAQYAKAGMDIKFVDNWNTHHNGGGEVHCGTNTIRNMTDIWW